MTTAPTRPRRAGRRRPGRVALAFAAVSGVVAAGLTLGVAELVGAIVDPVATPLLVIGSAVIDRVPPWLKTFAVEHFGSNDKTVLLGTLGVAVAVLAAAAGLVELARRGAGVVVVGVLGVVTLAAALSRAGAGALNAVPTLVGFGAGAIVLAALVERLRTDVKPATAPVVAPAGSYHPAYELPAVGPDTGAGASAAGLEPAPARPSSRRTFLVALGGTAVVAALSAAGGRVIGAAARNVAAVRSALRLPAPTVPAAPLPTGVELGVKGITPFTTPNATFYRVDTALSVLQIDPDTWSLRIHGLVEKEVRVSYADLRAAELVESRITLTCVSNEVGGNLAGNATWLGVPVSTFLAKAGPKAGADMVLSSSSDGFSASTPLESLTDPAHGALLAIGMNGEPLPLQHGFPVRMVVPGLYGFVSATKWVVDLEVTRFADRKAYWTNRGWSERAPIKTASRIDVPAGFATVPAGTVAVGGVAWAQTRGVTKVEVRVDAGPWHTARLGAQANKDTWRQWSWAWPATSGSHTLTVRATDGTGAVQPSARVAPIPNGSTGWQSVQVTVT